MHKECISLLSKCGPQTTPPSLPPRPASLLLPSPTHSSLARLSSTLSLTEDLPAINSGHEYVNTRIEEHAWFVGDMDRDQANVSMQLYPIGTFLVRARLQAGERVGYALSLRTKEDTKHMKINSGEHVDWGTKFYLSESHGFRSVRGTLGNTERHSKHQHFDLIVRTSSHCHTVTLQVHGRADMLLHGQQSETEFLRLTIFHSYKRHF